MTDNDIDLYADDIDQDFAQVGISFGVICGFVGVMVGVCEGRSLV